MILIKDYEEKLTKLFESYTQWEVAEHALIPKAKLFLINWDDIAGIDEEELDHLIQGYNAGIYPLIGKFEPIDDLCLDRSNEEKQTRLYVTNQQSIEIQRWLNKRIDKLEDASFVDLKLLVELMDVIKKEGGSDTVTLKSVYLGERDSFLGTFEVAKIEEILFYLHEYGYINYKTSPRSDRSFQEFDDSFVFQVTNNWNSLLNKIANRPGITEEIVLKQMNHRLIRAKEPSEYKLTLEDNGDLKLNSRSLGRLQFGRFPHLLFKFLLEHPGETISRECLIRALSREQEQGLITRDEITKQDFHKTIANKDFSKKERVAFFVATQQTIMLRNPISRKQFIELTENIKSEK